jgi:hypothetical protein
MPKLPQHIEERVDEILNETLIDGGFKMNSDTSDHDNWLSEEEAKLRIKSFIATILDEERKKLIDAILSARGSLPI